MEVVDIKKPEINTEVVDVKSGINKAHTYPMLVDRRDLSASLALGKTLKEVNQFYSTGITAPIESELNSQISSNRNLITSEKFDQALINQKPANETLVELNDYLGKIDFIKGYLDPGLTSMITGADPLNRDYAINKLSKLAVATNIIQTKIEQTVPNLFSLGTAGDFLDVALSSLPIYSLSVAKANQKFSDRFQEIVYSDLPLEVLEVELKKALDEASDAGLFTEDNSFFLMDMVDGIGYGSGSNAIAMQKFMGWVDVGFGVVGAASKVKNVGKLAEIPSAIKRASGAGANLLGDFSSVLSLTKATPAKVSELFENTVILDDVSKSAIKLGNQTISTLTPIQKRPTFLASNLKQGARLWEETSRANLQLRKILNMSGKALDETAVETLRKTIREKNDAVALESGDKRFIDSDVIIDDFENLVEQAYIGKKDGNPYQGKRGFAAAQKEAERMGSGFEVRPYVNPDEWVIVAERNIPMDQRGFGAEVSKETGFKDFDLYQSSSTEEMRAGPLVKYLGTPMAQTTARNNTLLKQAEAAKSLYTQYIKKTLGSVEKQLKGKELDEVFRVEELVRDNPDITQALTSSEFKTKFFNEFGKRPTKNQVTAYLVQRDLADAEAYIYADRRFKELVGQKAVVVNGVLSKPIFKSEVKAGSKVWDDDVGTLVDPDTLDETATIYANLSPLDGTMKGGSLYYTKKNPDVRRVYHSDVLQYNAGGHRIYEDRAAQFFIKQERKITLSDDTTVSVSPLTVMGVRTEQEANKAILQVNSIIDAITSKVGKSFKQNSEVADAIKALPKNKQDEITEVISKNNEWLTRLDDIDSLLDWAKEGNINLAEKFERVTDGERIVKTGEEFGVDESETYGDAFRANAFKSASRKDNILVGYGGRNLPTVSPRQALERSLLQSTGKATERAYITGAINGFFKEAIDNSLLTNKKDLRGATLRNKILDAKIDTGSTAGKRLELERQKIIARMNSKTFIAKQWDDITLSMSNYLYDKGLVKTSAFIDKFDKDPITALRGYVFDKTMGMFNYDQYWVQAMSTMDVVAIAGVNGVKGSALYGPVRFALANGNEAVIKSIGGLIEKATGLTEKQFTDMVKFLKESGRAVVGDEISEFGSDASQASLLFSKLREKGRFFVKEGELVSRIAGHNTAFIEFYAKFGDDADPFLEVNKRWIISRQDTLTLGMTGASRTSIEQFPFAQFLSYTQRVNEALFSGTFGVGKKILTNAEKTRLAAMHTVMYGAAGWTGFNFAADRIEHTFGIPIDENSYNLIRRGILDTTLSASTGVETDVGARLGAGEGMFTLLVDMADKNVFDFFLGPSGELGQSSLGAIINLAKNISSGNITSAGDDALLFLREIKTVNTAYNLYFGLKYNEARSRANNSYLYDVTDQEAYLRALGIPLEKEQDMFRAVQQTKIDKYFVQSTAKSAQKFQNNFDAAVRAKDWDEARRQGQFLSDLLNTLDPIERSQVQKLIFDSGESMMDNLIRQGIKNETYLLEGVTK